MSSPARLTLPMPRLGETMEEATIADWLVQPGQSFKRGDPLLEVETDKTMVEYPALGDGILVETLVGPGDVVEVGTPIAVIETRDAWDSVEEPDAAASSPGAAPSEVAGTAAQALVSPDAARLRATPLARRIARENHIALSQVTGTGRRGRIEAGDVRVMLTEGASTPAVIQAAPGATASVYCVHGFAGLGSNWAALRASLQRAGITSSAPDLPGHGRNRVDAGSIEALADWLAADLASQPEPVQLVGHSLGAHVAARAAQRVPSRVARLTLLAPAGCGIEINGAFLSGMAAAPSVGELAHLMRLLGRKAAELDNHALEALSRELQGDRLSALAAAAARADVQRIDTIAPLRSLAGKIPVRAIFGLSDQIIPRDHAFHLPPAVACHMLEAGHMPHWDATEEVASIIAAP
ncbi:acetoin dehydrogenase dihydrolipoyllysine-residue acetyltransferase subunit [Dinoroseobacter shibae]|nr:acetoin dehydrogenase dihydrolipoyllysine-residue acetyltransferase subunit [Dinoroseobacter shibae]URF47236.1 acetoin dehydrogenase dihydrolipoyllysine-residue acetyltransferase subunit [Dinoroseobacter shibae]URF51547.1 acetoin dehydrogenase dihydrolipoyllysine-residue acetyltransferase subunit [Dinoroseobacter shibae]